MLDLGDPTDDLVVATILLLVGGRLVLLRPKKVGASLARTLFAYLTHTPQSGAHEVKYDMHILADRIEFCWIHLRGIGTLENSLWGYDGKSIRVWLDALTMESAAIDRQRDAYESVAESVNIPLDFYPLCEFLALLFVYPVSTTYSYTVSRTYGQRYYYWR